MSQESRTSMHTFDTLRASLQQQINDAAARRERAAGEFRVLLAARRAAGAASKADVQRGQNLQGDVARLALAERGLRDQLARVDADDAEQAAWDARSRQMYPSGQPLSERDRRPAYDHVHRVTGEQHVYRSPAEHGTALDRDSEPSFLRDLFAAQVLSDPGALGRLERHGRQVLDTQPGYTQQMRAVGTTSVPGFAPPQYLVEEFAEYARAGRPTANLCRQMPLPAEGMTVNIPRLTTPTATGVQPSEGTALSNQDPASTLLSPNVNTIGGYVILSRQAVERGTILEQVVTGDLAADYAMRLDTQVLTGSGTSGQHLGLLNISGINSVTFTSGAPTVPLLWPKLVSALKQVWTGRFAGPTAFVMSPTPWAWILAAVDSQGRPLVEPEGVAQNPAAVQLSSDYPGAVGELFGKPVFMDGNLPDNLGAGTNESRVIAANFTDIYLFEDGNAAPAQLRFEAPAAQNLQILLTAYGYSAFAGGRQPKAISVVSGTGMIVPAL
jgi:HK97 family phage major capsid protein